LIQVEKFSLRRKSGKSKKGFSTVSTGIGAENGFQCDPFYHWGALLGFMDFIESGKVEAPEKPLNNNQ